MSEGQIVGYVLFAGFALFVWWILLRLLYP